MSIFINHIPGQLPKVWHKGKNKMVDLLSIDFRGDQIWYYWSERHETERGTDLEQGDFNDPIDMFSFTEQQLKQANKSYRTGFIFGYIAGVLGGAILALLFIHK